MSYLCIITIRPTAKGPHTYSDTLKAGPGDTRASLFLRAYTTASAQIGLQPNVAAVTFFYLEPLAL